MNVVHDICLQIGIPGYGRAFTADGRDPLKAFGQSGGGSGSVSSPYLGESGLLTYFEICKKELKEGFKRYWHQQHQIPISFKDGTWIGYDDPDSVRNKCQYVKREGFGGAMVWTLDMDDFTGQFCRKSKQSSLNKFPLISAIKEEFELDELTTTSSTQSIEITTISLSNQTNLSDEMFSNASLSSSSSSSKFKLYYFFLFNLLTSSCLIGSTIHIVA
ncbi:unnamed protein product [Rotaria socialis]|uniref:GH18 domain-containing protein n=1 Tax=Rotaria socialis TaxID=392032 RepID=A0A818SZ30_9BILA|nr:unnamed protein product [Rotaria socialis]CAF4778113.1 unnamed protein product [Rotaria socialis]